MPKIASVLFFSFILTVASPTYASEVVINELLPNHASGEDWVELFSSVDIDISGWILDDAGTSSDMATIPLGTTIGPSTNRYYSIDVGSRLNQESDTVTLFTPERGDPVDSYAYSTSPGLDISLGRFPDGQSWANCTPSKNIGNSGCTSPTMTPTETQSPTQTPTKTPTPTRTPTPSKTPTPTRPSLTPTNTASPGSVAVLLAATNIPTAGIESSASQAQTAPTEILGQTTSSAIVLVQTNNTNNAKFLITMLLIVGLLLAIASLILIWKNKKQV